MGTTINSCEDISNWINSNDPDKFSRENLQQIFQAGESNPIYLACYQFWYRALSINVKAVEQQR